MTFGAPPANPTALQANYQPARNFTPAPPAGFGTAASVATPTADIAAKCPTCPIPPPVNPSTTISAWSAVRPSSAATLTQTINRYGRPFSGDDAWHLLQEDPSFDVQAQFYGGATFGLLQVWPANASTTINNSSNKAALKAIYDPLKEPGTKLFDPNVGVEFGGAGDVYAKVTKGEGDAPWSYEPLCTPQPTTAPFSNCTWQRQWALRLTAFNAGSDDPAISPGASSSFANYGWPIIAGAGIYWPIPPLP